MRYVKKHTYLRSVLRSIPKLDAGELQVVQDVVSSLKHAHLKLQKAKEFLDSTPEPKQLTLPEANTDQVPKTEENERAGQH